MGWNAQAAKSVHRAGRGEVIERAEKFPRRGGEHRNHAGDDSAGMTCGIMGGQNGS